MINRVIDRHPYLRTARDSAREDFGIGGEFAKDAVRVFRSRLAASVEETPPPTTKSRKRS